MARATSSPPELPGLAFVRPLGAGGFSDVFLYDQRLPKRAVAVKVLLTDGLNTAARQAFVDEANLMAQLSAHPYIVTIFHADVSPDDRPYFVMEYCSGPSLAEQYKKQPFTVAEALRTGIRLSSAIATAHAAGILHRDIKPANVLTNDFGWPALTDFGISSAVEDELPAHTTTTGDAIREASGSTESQSVGMSVPWSPPEMFEDAPRPDVRSDVFSLAATVWTLLAGRTPFEIPGRSNGTLDLMGRIERGAITPLGREDVPRPLIAVLQKGMATRRADRYASAVDFARALQRIELELGFGATTIEVPNLVVKDETPPMDAASGDETRVRSVATIEAQPAPTQPDETRVRPVTIIPPVPVAEGTVLRTPIADATVQRSVARPVEEPAGVPVVGPIAEPVELRRRRPLAIIVTIVAVVVVAAAVTIGIVFAPPSDPHKAAPTAGATTGQNAIVDDGIPTPVLISAKSVDGDTAVTFTWKNPAAKAGDSYRWSLAEDPGEPKPTSNPSVTVKRPSKGARVCIDVLVQRSGALSPSPLTACNPK